MKKEYWNDLFIFLKTVQSGKLSDASRVLNMSTATLSRRLDALESKFGKSLLVRDTRGCKPTKIGQEIIPMIEVMQQASQDILSVMGHKRNDNAITILGNDWQIFLIMKRLHYFKKNIPLSNLKLITNNFSENIDNYRIELSAEKIEKDLIHSDKVGGINYGIYANIDYANNQKNHINSRLWDKLDFVTLDVKSKDSSSYNSWIQELTGGVNTSKLQCDYSLSVYDAVVAGLGIGIIECSTAEKTSSLVKLFPEYKIYQDVWVSIDKRIKTHDFVKFFDFLKNTFNYT